MLSARAVAAQRPRRRRGHVGTAATAAGRPRRRRWRHGCSEISTATAAGRRRRQRGRGSGDSVAAAAARRRQQRRHSVAPVAASAVPARRRQNRTKGKRAQRLVGRGRCCCILAVAKMMAAGTPPWVTFQVVSVCEASMGVPIVNGPRTGGHSHYWLSSAVHSTGDHRRHARTVQRPDGLATQPASRHIGQPA